VVVQNAVHVERLSRHPNPKGEFWIVPGIEDMEFDGLLLAQDVDAAGQMHVESVDTPTWRLSQNPSWHTLLPDYEANNALHLGQGTDKKETILTVFCRDETEGLFPHAAALAAKHVKGTSYKESRDQVFQKLMKEKLMALGAIIDFVVLTAVGGPHDGLRAMGLGTDPGRRRVAANLALSAMAHATKLPDVALSVRLEAAGVDVDLAFHAFAERAWKLLRDPDPADSDKEKSAEVSTKSTTAEAAPKEPSGLPKAMVVPKAGVQGQASPLGPVAAVAGAKAKAKAKAAVRI